MYGLVDTYECECVRNEGSIVCPFVHVRVAEHVW